MADGLPNDSVLVLHVTKQGQLWGCWGQLLVSTLGGSFGGAARQLKPVSGVPAQTGAARLSPDGSEGLLAVGGKLYRRDTAGR